MAANGTPAAGSQAAADFKQAFQIGATVTVLYRILMRSGESLNSPEILRLLPGTQCSILKHSVGVPGAAGGRRLKVKHEKSDSAGWISCVDQNGKALIVLTPERTAVYFEAFPVGAEVVLISRTLVRESSSFDSKEVGRMHMGQVCVVLDHGADKAAHRMRIKCDHGSLEGWISLVDKTGKVLVAPRSGADKCAASEPDASDGSAAAEPRGDDTVAAAEAKAAAPAAAEPATVAPAATAKAPSSQAKAAAPAAATRTSAAYPAIASTATAVASRQPPAAAQRPAQAVPAPTPVQRPNPQMPAEASDAAHAAADETVAKKARDRKEPSSSPVNLQSNMQEAQEPAPIPRLVLVSQGVPKPLATPRRTFRSVAIFGAHHTCTNALMRELPRFFEVSVRNKHRSDNPRLWKHRVLKRAAYITEDTLCICLTKDPAFWIQSLGRSPLEGTFYEIHPVSSIRKPELLVPTGMGQLFGPVLFDEELYSDALALWEATVRAYFKEAVLPTTQTAVVRSEDLLFNFRAVMEALSERGLRWRRDAPAIIEPLDDTAKDGTHPTCTRRGRPKLLGYYGDPQKRYAGMTAKHLERMRRVDPELIGPLGYGDNAVSTWLPRKEAAP